MDRRNMRGAANPGGIAVPAISVVIPVYNKGELFRKTLASALAQTFNDHEVVIIDDGSTDRTKAIVDSFNDRRIRYFYQDNSGLPASARNAGIRRALGRYIAFLDADDIWYPEKLRRCYEVLKADPAIDLICHDERIQGVNGHALKDTKRGAGRRELLFRELLLRGNCLSPSAVVVKKDAVVKVGMFSERAGLFSVEDYDLWLRLAKDRLFYFLPEVLGEYILHDNNISSSVEKHFTNQIGLVRQHFDAYTLKRPRDSFVINARISRMYLSIARSLLRAGNVRGSAGYGAKAALQLCGARI